MTDKMEHLRALHARTLNRNEVIADLPDFLRAAATGYARDEQDSRYLWAYENLPREDLDRIHSALSEQKRQALESAEKQALCSRLDEPALRSMYPGRAAFYDTVASPPPFEERPTDAVVVIELGAGSLVRKAKKLLECNAAKEALKVQYGGSPNQHAKKFNTERFFMGYYTPEIEARMDTPRPDCKRLGSSPYAKAACCRDITLSIVRDWLTTRGHQSVRFLLSDQSSWPQYEILFKRLLSDFDVCIDTRFDKRLSKKTSFLQELCGSRRGPAFWIDYEAYVNTLFPDT